MNRLGIITPLIASHHGVPIVAALYREARKAGAATVLVRTIHRDPSTYDMPLALDQADAWVLIHGASFRLIDQLLHSGRPTCVMGRDFGIPELGFVKLDNRAGIHAAMRHLYQRGHRHFAMVGGPTAVGDIGERHDAFFEFIDSHPDCTMAGFEQASYYAHQEACEATARLLARGARFTALLACNDAVALGAISVLRERGLQVPEDVAVVGFDNGVDARTPGDGLASIDQILPNLATAAFNDVAARLRDPSVAPARCYCMPAFIPRRSSGDEDGVFESPPISRDTVLSFATVGEETNRAPDHTYDSYLLAYFRRLGRRLRFGVVGRCVGDSVEMDVSNVFPLATPWAAADGSHRVAIRHFPFLPGSGFACQAGDLVVVLYSNVHTSGDNVVAMCLTGLNFDTSFAPELVLHGLEALGSQLQFLRMRESMVSAQASLRETQGELLRAERHAALGRIVAGISHGLNTPLGNSLLASSTLAAKGSQLRAAFAANSLKRSDVEGMLETLDHSVALLERNIATAARLIADFKGVTIESQGADAPAHFNLTAFLQQLAEVLRLSCERAAVELSLEVPAELPMCGYAQLIAQVVAELVDNALHHGLSGREHGAIFISARAEGSEVEITVADNGVGIAQESLGNIFDPFYTTCFGQSSGLGLTMVQNLVTGHLRGRVAVAASPGNGARFSVTLPKDVRTAD